LRARGPESNRKGGGSVEGPGRGQKQWSPMQPIPSHVLANARFFRDQLRDARCCATDDAEDFHDLLHAIERLGCALTGRMGALGSYQTALADLAERSALCQTVPIANREWHTPAAVLFNLLRNARNDALHQGAYARQLTTAAVQFAIVLEDALLNGSTLVADFMVRDPICAHPWQPISFMRQQMLSHQFSFLPVFFDERWRLISDLAVANYLRQDPTARNARLASRLEDTIRNDGLKLITAEVRLPTTLIADALCTLTNLPILICRDGSGAQDLVGIFTAFDLL